MNEETLKKMTWVIVAAVIVAAAVLVIDIGIKNTILYEANFVKEIYGETRDREAERTHPRTGHNGGDNSVLRVDTNPGMEVGILPTGGHDDDKVPFQPRGENGRFVPIRPLGHKGIPSSDEPMGT